jgi:catechol 2,3-dioxygenase-like lactoylglutathione lyase family enzyme
VNRNASRQPYHDVPVGWIIILLLLGAALFAQLPTVHGPQSALPVINSKGTVARVSGVLSVAMTVSDMDRAVEFYTRVLSFKVLSDTEIAGASIEHLQGLFGIRVRVVRLKLGDEMLELTQYLTPLGRPIPTDSRSNDLWFQHIAIIVRDMDEAYAWLRKNRIQHVSTAPQTIPEWNRAAAGIRAFYFKDPDGHTLEILSFPADKGNAKWHRTSSELFLGIDHTAIAVSDTIAALRFYRDTLGMQVAGESEKYGTEQEHLNNVFGARLRITSLFGAMGPKIELLEYITPRNGRAIPADARASDIAHWQTRILTYSADALSRSLVESRLRFISPGVVAVPPDQFGFSKALMVRDPDGHAMQFVEQLSMAVKSSESGAGK